jgi:hypothetical protein
MQATRWIAALAFALLAVPVGARAGESEAERFQALEERMRVLEDKLAASTATIEAQQELLQKAAPDVAQGSALDAFFNKLEVGGFVTGSYLYNFNQPSTPSTGFGTQPLNQFNNRHDEFSFDAAKLELGKAAANPGEAGFQLEMLYGQNGDILRRASPTRVVDNDGDGTPDTLPVGGFGDSDMGVFIQEAYAAYNLNGVTFKLGKFETLLGYEVLDSHKNPSITHGILFTWAIPLYHTGLLASGALSENVTWALGITDGFNNVIENNDGKGLLGQIAYTSGPLFMALNGFWGGEGSQSGDNTVPPPAGLGSVDDFRIADAVLSYSPSDTMSFWINADIGEQEDQFLQTTPVSGVFSDSDPYYWGVAAGGKFQISEKLGFAVRGEYFDDEDDMRGTAFGTCALCLTPGVDDAEVQLWSLTGTASYQFTPSLRMRGELRWDHADNDISSAVAGAGGGNIFSKGSSGVDDEAILGILEVSYIFD